MLRWLYNEALLSGKITFGKRSYQSQKDTSTPIENVECNYSLNMCCWQMVKMPQMYKIRIIKSVWSYVPTEHLDGWMDIFIDFTKGIIKYLNFSHKVMKFIYPEEHLLTLLCLQAFKLLIFLLPFALMWTWFVSYNTKS